MGGNSDNSFLNKDNTTNNGKIKITSIELYLPHYTSSIPQQAILCKQILCQEPIELQYSERSVSTKKLKTQKLWSFELGTQEELNVPIWIVIGVSTKG